MGWFILTDSFVIVSNDPKILEIFIGFPCIIFRYVAFPTYFIFISVGFYLVYVEQLLVFHKLPAQGFFHSWILISTLLEYIYALIYPLIGL
ncbi:hypothetical protein BCV72DRAFT_328604 [Rhizopus microsporus var. microsporus]|uniref:Uncharacterized protein n=2 Tax=Rhizopus microsporus TaxID=58291 RepID=A0A2G4SMT1_RHIZD|nr:uncharacterized protein RHIMIDRAFT_42363 [Rhizopus microsporus ATCC 52813]ORE11163.1 hypothetical protein BCV72DRAFT_328604 [Rhizopus microsporus var. microsporus]PHZ10074.1 hypothetical protein RHIMIDRAFT_42363 [Rhizopus microsporus ATCC 52813]